MMETNSTETPSPSLRMQNIVSLHVDQQISTEDNSIVTPIEIDSDGTKSI
jgi:hypothetical protein